MEFILCVNLDLVLSYSRQKNIYTVFQNTDHLGYAFQVCMGDGNEIAIKRFINSHPMDGAVSNMKLNKKRYDDTHWWCGLRCEASWSGSKQNESQQDGIGNWIHQSEFENELNVLSKLTHKNIIKVLGHCTAPEVILVYEYMASGSLDTFLFCMSCSEVFASLNTFLFRCS